MSFCPTTALRVLALLLFTLSPLSGRARAADAFVLVSDVDDTVKLTNVLDHGAAVTNALASELVFAGMPDLYRGILGRNSSADHLRFLSGSPILVSHEVRELLDHAHFPAYTLTLRGAKELTRSALDYKTKQMQELYGASGDSFLLVGDDTESDPEVYAAFAAPRRNQVLGIYIHRITGRALPLGSIAFVTAYDIAMREFVADRLSETQAADVGKAVLNSRDSIFLPDFQQCPKGYEQIAGLSEALVQLKNATEGRMTALCSNRANMRQSH
jgi:Phosphatidate phosphatase APP1, catalytic domain